MPVKIRLMRIGAKKRPFYRIVAVDERKKRTGGYIENIGTYNPLTEPKEIILKQERLEYWTKQGAVLSDGFLRITKQAPQKPPRKPKKAPVEQPMQKPAEPKASETPAPEVTQEAAPEEASVADVTNPETEAPESAPTENLDQPEANKDEGKEEDTQDKA